MAFTPLYVNNAFLHGTLFEAEFMQHSLGFVDQTYPSFVCELRKAIYDPNAWFAELKVFSLSYGFANSRSDSLLFIYRHNAITLYVWFM